LFVEECLGFLNPRIGVKIYWLNVPNENSVNNVNSIKREASSLFRNK
jgi:hypothetical protein